MNRLILLLALPVCAQSVAPVDALIEAGHWKRARAQTEARLRANPNDAQAHAWLSKIRGGFGDLEGSIESAGRSVALNPNSASNHAQLAEACAMMADKAHVWKSIANVRRMKREIAAALALDERHIDTMLVDMMFSWKAPSIAGGDKALAERLADRILSISTAWGALAHARLLQDQGDDATTEGWLKRAVQAEPGFYRARVSLARFYCCTSVRHRPELAEKAALEAIALDPEAEPAYSILARVYASQQRWSDLENVVERASRAVPDNLGPFLAGAQALLDTGQDFRRAERYIARYLSQPPEGRQPTHAEAHWLLAALHEKEGRKQEAIRELRAALELESGFEPARASLKRLLRA
ncbi:MAG: tetratricopeptide repeat protein [Candidatus Solibacter usitatus]|nr:tetratricopeptide repeat protein [Candidatus Solibacter usitatus]